MANPRFNKQTTNRRGAMGGGRMKKMGGGMTRKMYSKGSNGNGKKFGAGDGVITPYEKRRGQAIEAAIKARKGQRKSPLKEMTKPKKIKGPMERS